MYGGDAYPMPPEVNNLVAAGIMNVQSQLVENIKLEEISRDNVMQGPLVKVWYRIFATYRWSDFQIWQSIFKGTTD